MPSNNDFLSDLAALQLKNGLTNNQLLQLIVAGATSGSPVTKQAAIAPLAEDATEADLWAKINEIITVIKAAGVTE